MASHQSAAAIPWTAVHVPRQEIRSSDLDVMKDACSQTVARQYEVGLLGLERQGALEAGSTQSTLQGSLTKALMVELSDHCVTEMLKQEVQPSGEMVDVCVRSATRVSPLGHLSFSCSLHSPSCIAYILTTDQDAPWIDTENYLTQSRTVITGQEGATEWRVRRRRLSAQAVETGRPDSVFERIVPGPGYEQYAGVEGQEEAMPGWRLSGLQHGASHLGRDAVFNDIVVSLKAKDNISDAQLERSRIDEAISHFLWLEPVVARSIHLLWLSQSQPSSMTWQLKTNLTPDGSMFRVALSIYKGASQADVTLHEDDAFASKVTGSRSEIFLHTWDVEAEVRYTSQWVSDRGRDDSRPERLNMVPVAPGEVRGFVPSIERGQGQSIDEWLAIFT